jgi:hypothetical protein
VAGVRGGWNVTYGDAPIGHFETCEAAAAFACGLARTEAQIGVFTTVVVDAPIHEVHHFRLSSDRAM